jgi:hypothetical protein
MVKENPADTAVHLAMGDIEIVVCPGLEPGIVFRIVCVAGRLVRGVEIGSVLGIRDRRIKIAAAAILKAHREWIANHETLPVSLVEHQARAVLLALREPTDGMLLAAQYAWLHDPERKSSTLWRAMIDAALNAKEPLL